MKRFEEDLFLRTGGDYSRNCLSFQEEEEERLKLDELTLEPPPPSLGTAHFKHVFVSAGGKATESLVKVLVNPESGKWQSNALAQFAVETGNQGALAVLCPVPRPSPHRTAYQVNMQERQLASWVASQCDVHQGTVVVFGTVPAREQPADDLSIRIVGTDTCEFVPKHKQLEAGRLLTSNTACLVEACRLAGVRCVCLLAPRETVLAVQTLDCLFKAMRGKDIFKTRLERVHSLRKEWVVQAIREDERQVKKQQPEGMFT